MTTDRAGEDDDRAPRPRGAERAAPGDPTTDELDAIAWNLPRAPNTGPGGEAAEPDSPAHGE